MLSLHAGYDVAYLTDAVGAGGADYYLSAAGRNGEPPGYWAGKGASALGLTGAVDADVMRALYHHGEGADGELLDGANRPHRYDGMADTLEDRINAEVAAKVAELGPYATEREIAEVRLRVASKQRNHVPFFDFTLSAAKSISVTQASYLAAAKVAREAGDQAEAQRCTDAARAIEQAVRAGAEQVVRSAERSAGYVRTGHHGDGQGQWRDAAGLTAAIFVQHTSRDGDPQLHAHIALLNKAQRADGADAKWRTLDSRSLHRERLGLAARAGMVVEQHLLAAGFSLVQREDGNGREIGGVEPATMRAFSSRRTAITPAIQQLVEEYVATRGRAPSRRALWSIRQWAALETRRSKHEVERSPADSLRVWAAQSEAAEVQLLSDVRAAVEEFGAVRGGRPAPCAGDLHRAVRIAVHEVQRQNATWSASQLAWELFRAMPPRDAMTDPVGVLQSMLADALSGAVDGVDIVPLAPAPDVTDVSMLGIRASDGRSVYRPPGEARYCTADMLDVEDWLIRSARRKIRQAVSDSDAAGAVAGGLSPNQAEVVKGLLTATTAVAVLVGPAGSGKTYAMARFAEAWGRLTNKRVIGITASTNAARQLASEGMPVTYNIAQFLGKLAGTDATRGHVPVLPGDVLVVDEASQVSTADLAAIMDVAFRAGARMILTGDTAQLGAVDAGGMMGEISRHQGYWKLNEVRRFKAGWESRASLEMRAGDMRAWAEYKAHGRVRSGPQDKVYAKAVELYVADYAQGRESLLLAGSNAEAADLARMVRAELVRYGVIPGTAEVTLSDGNDAGTGDLVRARLNSRIPAAGQDLTNRDVLRITGWTGEGEKRKAVAQRKLDDGWSGEFEVPVIYLADNAELAYAGNVHVAQGRTVESGHLVVSDTLSREALYVGMTRGWWQNIAHVVTGPPEGKTPQEQAPPEAVLAGAMNREAQEASATQTVRDAQRDATSSRHLFELWRDVSRHEAGVVLDEAVKARLPDAEYQRYQQDPARPVFEQQMRQAQLAGHDVGEVLDQVTGDGWEGARSVAGVLHGRVAKLDLGDGGETRTWTERTPPEAGQSPPGQWRQALDEIAASLDHRQAEIGAGLADKPEPWAVRYLGMPPAEPGPLRDDWIARAGVAGSYREAAGHTDPEQAVGPYPARNPELAEAYQSSVRALEMQQAEETSSLDRGALESRVKEYERVRAWAPEPVGQELESVAQAEQDATAQAAGFQLSGDQDMERSASVLRDMVAEERSRLEVQRAARDEWEELHAPDRQRAEAAVSELQQRGHDEPDLDRAEPEQEPAVAEAEPTAVEPEAVPEHEHESEVAEAEPVAEVEHDVAEVAEPAVEREAEPAVAEVSEPTTEAVSQHIDATLAEIEQNTAARDEQRASEREMHEAEAAQWEAERASAAWQDPELTQPEADVAEAEAEPELEI